MGRRGGTLRPGEEWGRGAPLPTDSLAVQSDADAAALVSEALARGVDPPPIHLEGGDLWRTLGGRQHAVGESDRPVSVVDVDVGILSTETLTRTFVAHVVAGYTWWGRLVAVMNAEWFGRRIVAPGAHPGDGLLDVVEMELDVRQRIEAFRRARSGSHLPHPGIRYSRKPSVELVFERPVPVLCDGVRIGRHRRMCVVLDRTITVSV
ncbi:MAG: hypothetical protein KatS3mg008_0269 [Acidimicrobiales bacterium]|nr:MAG: hypothetical protein KatS3mg008_0269 [Acidimicrobiales bacterium]